MNSNKLQTIGWREWVGLPELGIEKIKAKIDTGAKTSTLHAFAVNQFKKRGKQWVEFRVHPLHHQSDTVACICEIHDIRWVIDSGGHREQRLIIKTPLWLGKQSWPIELTLTNRDLMRFHMLIGREAIKKHFIVDPGKSYLMRYLQIPAEL